MLGTLQKILAFPIPYLILLKKDKKLNRFSVIRSLTSFMFME